MTEEQRQRIVQTFLDMERDITKQDPRPFPYGRLNGFKEGLTLAFGADIIEQLHDEAFALHGAEFVDGKYVAK